MRPTDLLVPLMVSLGVLATVAALCMAAAVAILPRPLARIR